MPSTSMCAYCARRRGKRNCPALGSICPPCCGRHRLCEIVCPSDCPYLLRGGAAGGEALTTGIESLVRYTMSAGLERSREAADAFLGPDRRLEEWEADSFTAYLAYGHRGKDGKLVLDIFLSDRSARITGGERAALARLREAWPSLFEVLEVHPEEGLDLHDLIAGEDLFVSERLATRQIEEGDHLLAWVRRREAGSDG